MNYVSEEQKQIGLQFSKVNWVHSELYLSSISQIWMHMQLLQDILAYKFHIVLIILNFAWNVRLKYSPCSLMLANVDKCV